MSRKLSENVLNNVKTDYEVSKMDIENDLFFGQLNEKENIILN